MEPHDRGGIGNRCRKVCGGQYFPLYRILSQKKLKDLIIKQEFKFSKTMKYCARCLYPENAKPTIIIDDEDGICSGCKYHESRQNLEINWEERQAMFGEIMEEADFMAKERGNNYDCIIQVSG